MVLRVQVAPRPPLRPPVGPRRRLGLLQVHGPGEGLPPLFDRRLRQVPPEAVEVDQTPGRLDLGGPLVEVAEASVGVGRGPPEGRETAVVGP